MDIIGGLLHVVLLFLWIPGALPYDNIALNKPASQSSSDDNLAIDPPPASRANDGDGTNVASMIDNSCINTKKRETQAWWRVDLGDIHWIDQVYITYRDWRYYSFTSAGRLGGFSIYVSDTENWWDGYRCYKNEEKPSVSRTGYPCNAVGRYVTIYNDRNSTDAPFPDYYYNPTTDKAALELCEVEIDGCSSGTFGSNCNQICSSNCATRDICTYNNGTCLYGCDPGFYLADCSSPCSANCNSNTCERSNGDCIGGCKTGYYTSTCSNKCPDNCMNNECEQSTGNCVTCKAGLKGEKCDQPKCDAGKYGSDCTESCPNCGGNGRCDFTTGVCTYGCDDGYHGNKCLLLCSVNCGGSGACDITTAACIGGCKAGWVGQTCDKAKCDAGKYGSGCTESCPNCGGNGRCDFTTGVCTYGCDDGYHGNKCLLLCSVNCGGSGACDITTAACIGGCKAGWVGQTCDKAKCDAGKYGSGCTESCPNCGGNGRCDFTTGVCTYGCDDGYHGNKCLLLCSVNCGGSGACDITTAACIGGCKAGWVGQTCDKAKCDAGKYGSGCTESCPNCGGNGRCDFTTGVCTYGCDDGYHGNKCLLLCSVNCGGSGACDITTAACIGGCKAGWVGQTCDKAKCDAGKYGSGCTESCPNCGGNGRCDFTTGVCTYGCDDGYHGTKCLLLCSVNCGGSGACDITTAACIGGCNTGWVGQTCDKEGCAQAGYYGAGCTERCPNCGGDGTCEFQTGKCTFGCKMGWIGDMCSQIGCEGKRYGLSCSRDCPENCGGDGACDFITGNCPQSTGCKDGWRGDKCDEVCSVNLFGKGCRERCGLCYNDTCHHVTGICPHGCVQDWEPPSCNIKTQADEQMMMTNELNSTALILGLVLSVIIVALVVIIALMSRKRGATPTGNQPIEIEDINNYEAITSRDPEPNHIYSVMSGSSGRQGDNNTEEDNYTPLQPKAQDGADDHYYSDLELGK